MYFKMRLVDVVRVAPESLGGDIKEVILHNLREKLEGRIDKKLGSMIAVLDIVKVGEGSIIAGDGGVYYRTTFDSLVFRPNMQEVIEGKIVETVEFGAFIGLGPMDGLLHVSQITDDYISYDEKGGRLVCKAGDKAITEGDSVRARIVAISLNERDPRESKIGLTMRQPALGKLEWINEMRNKTVGK